MFKNYYEARAWLESFIPQTYTKENLGLGRITHLLKLLGNPQNKFKSIHIAGTSGKGSLAFYMARLLYLAGPVSRFPPASARPNSPSADSSKSASLRAGGSPSTTATHKSNVKDQMSKVKIGLHLSPHLTYIGERMQVNGRAIAVRDLVSLISHIRPIVEAMGASKAGFPSYFEILVAASFLYFAKKKVDFAVVEVGLGGRLDATNVLVPEISIITNVGLDHTDILGQSLEKIAFEKAGIIKDRTPVVTAAGRRALEVIKKVAKKKNAPLVTKNTLFEKTGRKTDQLRYLNKYYDILKHNHNYLTKDCIFLSLSAMTALDIPFDNSTVIKAFNKVFAGRFEPIGERVILDGAHNLDKVRVLVDYLGNLRPKGVVLVVGFKKGKDWQGMLDLLVKNLPIEKIIATQFVAPTDAGFFEAVPAKEIADYVRRQGYSLAYVYSNSHEAVFEVLQDRRRGGLVLVTGSLYLVGEVRTLWHLPPF